jgi:hypothetical protein
MWTRLRGLYKPFPWREMMLGTGMLNITFGAFFLLLADAVVEPSLTILKTLAVDQAKSLYILIAKSYIAYWMIMFSIGLMATVAPRIVKVSKNSNH